MPTNMARDRADGRIHGTEASNHATTKHSTGSAAFLETIPTPLLPPERPPSVPTPCQSTFGSGLGLDVGLGLGVGDLVFVSG
jgi:hypothetical protein